MNERWFLDMDGTLAEWKVGCEAELLSEGYFRNLKPTEFVNPFREYAKEHPENVYILSHCLVEGYAYGDKQAWLDQYLPEITKEHRLLLPCGVCKADYVIDVFHLEKLPETWILFDDYSKNLHAWKAAGGIGLKCYNGINGTHGTWKHGGIMWSGELAVMLTQRDA